jgi:hypothetical protein
MSRPDPTTAAQEILAERFSGANVVFLSGSVTRGEGTETSDLEGEKRGSADADRRTKHAQLR